MEYFHRLLDFQRPTGRRVATWALGKFGCYSALRIVHRVLLWVIYVVILELGTRMTFLVVGFFDAPSTMNGQFAIWIEGGIFVLSLLWFIAAESLDLVEYIIRRIVRIRTHYLCAQGVNAPSTPSAQHLPPHDCIREGSGSIQSKHGVRN